MSRIFIVFATVTVFCFYFLTGCSGAHSITESEAEITPAAYDISTYIHLLEGKRVAIMANQTSEIHGVHLVDTLLNLGIDVKTIFAPEHGFRGNFEAGETVSNNLDKKTGIPVLSLYGNHYKPTRDDLADIDVCLFDIQDVGVRFFTYLSSLHYLMEACGENNIPLIILDRPNPLSYYIDGPILNEKFRSFVGLHPVPIVYGLTLGEFSRMINGEYWLKDSLQCKVTVIPCLNYTHQSRYKLPISPSPNLPDMRSVYLYPSVALFEGTVLSEGRGTYTPFQVFGHPEYPDTSFSFTPKAIKGMSSYPKFRNKTCYGVDLTGISIDTLINFKEIQWDWLIDAYHTMDIDKFFIPFFENLTGDVRLREAIVNEVEVKEIKNIWKMDLEHYLSIRKKYLLYSDETLNEMSFR